MNIPRMADLDLDDPAAGPYILGRAVSAALQSGDLDLDDAADLANQVLPDCPATQLYLATRHPPDGGPPEGRTPV